MSEIRDILSSLTTVVADLHKKFEDGTIDWVQFCDRADYEGQQAEKAILKATEDVPRQYLTAAGSALWDESRNGMIPVTDARKIMMGVLKENTKRSS